MVDFYDTCEELNDYSSEQYFLSRAAFAKERDMNCVDDEVYIAGK